MSKNTTTIGWIALATFASLGLSQAFAQGNDVRLSGSQIVDKNAYTNLPNFIKIDPRKDLTQENFVNWAVYAFNVPNNSTFVPYNVVKDKLGYTHTRHKQYINGIPVEGTQVISHEKDGKVTMVNGDYYQNFSSNLTASLTEQSALQNALKKVNAKKYMWENEFQVRIRENDFIPHGELVMVHKKGADYSSANMRLAYKFNIYAEVPLYRANVFVDANTGEILDEQNLICTVTVVGTADTKYSGTVTMSCDNNAGTYRLRETGRGNGIITKNLNNGSSYGSAVDFTNGSSSWTSTGNDQAATDAHWGAEMTYDYYWQTHNLNSIDGAGYALNSYVHYSTNYVNAFWDGTEMTYGDGDLSQDFDIMTALDVCGHEITHGLVSNTANLGSGEAGALNEGFADIFGTTIEAFARPAQNDWIMGADIMPSHTGIRDMSQPKNLGQPNTYLGQNWDTGLEPHTDDGPCIYWYYLLCQGGSGTNDNNNAFNVSGLGMSTAQFIAYRGLTNYFTSSTSYTNARQYTIQAATDLYGACSQEVAQTTNAWYAVGVGAAYAGGVPTAGFGTTSALSSCSAPLTVNFTNSTTGATSYVWNFGDGGTSTSTSPAHTYTAGGVYAVQLVATGSCSANSKDTLVKTNYVIVNGPPAATNPAPSCGASTSTLTANGVGTITWSNASGTVAVGPTYVTPTISTTTSYSVTSSIMTAGSATLAGAPTNTAVLGSGSFLAISNNHYLVFDVMQAFTLKNLDVYVQTSGTTLTVQLLDNLGNVVGSITPTLVTGKNTLSMNWHVPVGAGYRLTASGTCSLYRNNAGASYPISVGTIASITGNDVMSTAPAYYYWFYNWVYAKDVPCPSNPTVVTITVNQTPTVTATSGTVCVGSSANLNASGAGTYTWNPGGMTGSSVNVSPSATTTYVVTGSNSGCNGTSNAVVVVNTLPTIGLNAAQDSICAGGNTGITASGGASYTWSPASSLSAPNGSAVTASPGSTTTYTVVGTGNNGCTNTAVQTVVVNICTGISSHTMKGVEVYPNPAHDNLFISSEVNIRSISIVDMIGKTIFNQQPSNETNVSIDVSSFPAGVYFVKVSAGEEQKLIKVIKQ